MRGGRLNSMALLMISYRHLKNRHTKYRYVSSIAMANLKKTIELNRELNEVLLQSERVKRGNNPMP
jgi:hypothetical protein